VSDLVFGIVSTTVKLGVVIGALMTTVAVMTWIERRLSGMIQFRLGPNRVGPLGLFQPLADGIKFIMKEDIIPDEAYRPTFVLAPGIALVTALCAFAVIPFGPRVELFGRVVSLQVIDLDGGILVVLAATGLGVYGVVLAGWSSMNKYSLMGGLRASAQMVSYELALGLSVVGVILVSGTLRPMEIVEQQAGWFINWNAFAGGWQFLGFMIFVIAVYAETNRLPFDMPEAESELVAGYHTEYSSMKFSMFFMAEYIAMTTGAAMAVTLFLGGWQIGVPVSLTGWPLWGLQIFAFLAKMSFFMVLYVWVRWTLPRFRYDQLMNVGWKGLLPLALANVMFTAVIVTLEWVGGK